MQTAVGVIPFRQPDFGRQLDAAVLPLVLRLDASVPGGFDRAWAAYRGIGPNRHRAYAFQWFSLAAALAVIYVAVNTRRIDGR